MNWKKNLGLALLSGTFLVAIAVPASAQAYSYGQSGNVPQNTSGFAGAKVYTVADQSRGADRRDGRWDQRDNRRDNRWDRRDDRRDNRWDRRDDRRDNRWDRRDDRRDNRWDHRQDRRNYNRNYNRNYGYNNRNYNYGRPAYQPRYSWNPSRRVVYAPNFYYPNYRPYYSVGGRFYDYNRYRINDYQRWGLYHPPQGYYWVRHNNDAYLAAAGTGLIAGIIIGALAGGY